MTVRRFRLTNHAKKAPQFNWETQIDADIQVMSVAAGFAAHEADTQNMTVVVDAGRIQSGITLTSKAVQTTGTITAPVTNPRIDRVVIDYAGAISVITGAEAASPSAPAITASKIAVCQIALSVGQTIILNSHITDERPIYFVPNTFEDLTVTDDLNVQDDADIDGDLNVDGNAVIDGTLSVGGVAVNLPVHGTPVATTSGTAVQFTGLPSWVRKITVMFSGVSLSGTNQMLIQFGDSGGYENTGYTNAVALLPDAGAISLLTETTGLRVQSNNAGDTIHGQYIFTLLDPATNLWVGSAVFERAGSLRIIPSAGSKALSATLTQLQIIPSGADTFDAGAINIRYEY